MSKSIRVEVHKMDKGPRALVCMKLGVFKAFYYGDTLIGCSSPEGDYKLSLAWGFNARTKSTLAAKMRDAGLEVGWVGKKTQTELEEIVYRGWLANFAAHARERMAGGYA